MRRINPGTQNTGAAILEQRIYHGSVSSEGLADYLVQRYSGQNGVLSQKFGEGNSLLVQVGHGESPSNIRHAVTVAIANKDEATNELVVTMGQRQWITPEEAQHAAFWGLLAIILTPWVLFALLWPLSEIISSSTLPADIWNAVEAYAASQGATSSINSVLTHPHIG